MRILLMDIKKNEKVWCPESSVSEMWEIACMVLDQYLMEIDTCYERISKEMASSKIPSVIVQATVADVLVFWNRRAKKDFYEIVNHYESVMCCIFEKRTVLLKSLIVRENIPSEDGFGLVLWKHGIYYDARMMDDVRYHVNCMKRLYRLVAIQYEKYNNVILIHSKRSILLHSKECASIAKMEKDGVVRGRPINILTGWLTCKNCMEKNMRLFWPEEITEYEILQKGFSMNDLYAEMLQDAFNITCRFVSGTIEITTGSTSWRILLDSSRVSHVYCKNRSGDYRLQNYISDNPFTVISYIAQRDQKYFDKLRMLIVEACCAIS